MQTEISNIFNYAYQIYLYTNIKILMNICFYMKLLDFIAAV